MISVLDVRDWLNDTNRQQLILQNCAVCNLPIIYKLMPQGYFIIDTGCDHNRLPENRVVAPKEVIKLANKTRYGDIP